MSEFETEYRELFDRALALGLKARHEGLLALCDDLDHEKEAKRDIFEWGLRFAMDGVDRIVIDKILANLINQETDKDKITMGKIKKDAILAIQAGWPHYLIALLMNSHVNIDVEKTLRKFGMDGEDRYKSPSFVDVVCKMCGQTNILLSSNDTPGECIYCGNKIQLPENETPLTEQDIRYNKAKELYDARQYLQAKPLIEELANEGYAPAQSLFGNYYYYGDEECLECGVDKDWEKANEWYRKAAEQNDPRGLCNLGLSYANGEGIEKDEVKGFELCSRAAKLGFVSAQFFLGSYYYEGKCVEMDLKKAASWYRKAAYQGSQAGQEIYGTLLYYGDGVGNKGPTEKC
jgi:tetratricopeptide (TPR) repeat protein